MTDGIILIAEDDGELAGIVERYLTLSGFTVALADNGQKALDRALSMPRPDLILLDVMMPEMDGLTACRELRKLDEFDAVPILMFTALRGIDQDAMDAGANGVITKPFDLVDLQQRIRKQLYQFKWV